MICEAMGSLNKSNCGWNSGAIKLECRRRGRLHKWTYISLRYLHILAKEYYKAGAERAPVYFLVESCASTSSSGFSTCH